MPIYLTLGLSFCNFITMAAARVVLSLYALSLGAEAYTVGLLAATFYLFPLLLSWPVGVLADRFGSRWLLMLGSVCGAGGLLLPYFVHAMHALFIAAAMTGLLLAFYNVITQNLVGILSKPHERTRNFSTYSLIGASTNFFGPLLAGISIDHVGYAPACLVVLAPALVGSLALALWGGVLPSGHPHAAASEKILDTLKDTRLWHMLAISGLVQLGLDLFQFYIPIYGHGIGLSASAIGSVLAAYATASFIVRFAMPRLVARFSEEKLLVYSMYIGTLGFLLAPFSGNAVLLALVAFVFGAGMGCCQPLVLILMFSRSAPGRSGATLGLRLSTNNVIRTVAPPLFGLIATAFGLLPVFLINALMMAAGGLLSGRRTRTPDAGPDA